MTRVTRAALVVALALLPRPSRAQASGAADGITLRDAVDSALRNNFGLRVARAQADSARAESRIARALPNPTYAVIPGTPMQYSGTIALDVGPQRLYRTRASDYGARAASLDTRDTTRQVVLAVRRAFYDVLLADARRRIVGDRQAIVRQVAAADSVRVRAGDLPERALVRSEVELVRSEADLARAGIEAQITRLTLQTLMGVTAPDTALRVQGELRFRDVPVDTEGGVRAAVSRPDVAASREREAQSAAVERLAASAILPVPQLSYVRQFSAPFESGRYSALGIGFEVPVLNQYRGQRERAAAGRDAAGYARRRVEAQATRDVRSALAEFGAQRSLVQRYESGVIAKVAQNVEATRYAYMRGAASLLELLDALRAQQDVLTDYYTALHDYWVAVYTVEAAEGIVPPAPR
jgi:cobalt-zinc-cadmium efflux system outer membrane protein